MGNCIGNIMSELTQFSEKFSMFVSFVALLTCAVLCIFTMLACGIGLGYNYSYVDRRSKQTFVARQYTTLPPEFKFGPGYFKPLPGYSPRSFQQQSEVTASPNFAEQANEIGSRSQYEIVEDVVPALLRSKLTKIKKENQLEDLYFKEQTTKLRLSFNQDGNSIAETTTNDSNITDVEDYDRIEEESNASIDINETEYKNESKSVMVNVSETNNNSASPKYAMKTMLLPDQLSKLLARLQQENKTFAVHVAVKR